MKRGHNREIVVVGGEDYFLGCARSITGYIDCIAHETHCATDRGLLRTWPSGGMGWIARDTHC
jgi:hypothetical protein